jgi:hypothetical protein
MIGANMLSRAIDHGFSAIKLWFVTLPDALRARAEFTELLRKARQLPQASAAFLWETAQDLGLRRGLPRRLLPESPRPDAFPSNLFPDV